jgi:tight adherence protein B
MEILLSVASFVVILLLLEAIYSVFKGKDKRSVQKAVKKYTVTPKTEAEIDILYRRKLSDVPLLNWLLGRFKFFSSIDNFLQQSGTNMLVGVYLLLSFAMSAFGFLVPMLLNKNRTTSIVCSVLATLIPTIFIIIKRKQRSSKFEQLFPEALDLLGYSLRAGHSIMTGMKMVADEISDPVGREFGRVVEEVNFGRGLNSALFAFAERLDTADVKFFATSVTIQRETGGNLVELLESVSATIRKRFRFREKVKALAAEGKLSGIILSALPFVFALYLYIGNRKYLDVLLKDPNGMYIIGAACILMSIGMYVMYKITDIE